MSDKEVKMSNPYKEMIKRLIACHPGLLDRKEKLDLVGFANDFGAELSILHDPEIEQMLIVRNVTGTVKWFSREANQMAIHVDGRLVSFYGPFPEAEIKEGDRVELDVRPSYYSVRVLALRLPAQAEAGV